MTPIIRITPENAAELARIRPDIAAGVDRCVNEFGLDVSVIPSREPIEGLAVDGQSGGEE